MIDDIKELTISEQVDLAITQTARVEKALIKLHEILGGEDKRLKSILAEVIDMHQEMKRLKEEGRLTDRKRQLRPLAMGRVGGSQQRSSAVASAAR
jgi:hypothetical protein